MIRGLFWQTFAAVVGLVILLALGIWQLERLQWKEGLIARVTAGLTAAPVAAPAPAVWPGLDVGGMEYTPVVVHGHFLNDREMYATATLTEPKGKLGGYGLFVMTPFQTDDGWVVFVDRGFVPFELKAPSARMGSEIEGETTVSGPIRAPIDRSWFMPADDKAGNQWFSRDPKLYAAADGFPPGEVAPYIIDAKFDPTLPNGLPQGGETIIDFPNNHLGYALTWFGMAACLVGVYGAYVWGKVRPKRPLDAVS